MENKIRLWQKLKITRKNFQSEELPHELFITARQKTKIRNAFAKNISTYLKLSKGQLYGITQLGGCLEAFLGKFAGPLMKVNVPLAKKVLESLATMVSASTIDDTTQKKMRGGDVVKAGKRTT